MAQRVRAKRIKLQSLLYRDVRGFSLHSQIANGPFKDTTAALNNSGKVRKDGAYERFRELLKEGYTSTHFRLNHRCIHVTLRKDYEIREDYNAILGVDVGVKRLASISVINGCGRVLKQLYLGQNVGDRQRDIDLRRSKLRRYEDRYTTTRCWQAAHEITAIAEMYNALISIEDLHGLKNARGCKKGNRKSKRTPYHKLRVALESVAGEHSRLLAAVNPRGTSHTCSKCGAGGSGNKAVFKCPKCGYQGNADRNASINVAIRAGTGHPNINGFFVAQISDGNHAVNHGARVHDRVGIRCLQHSYQLLRHAHSFNCG